MNEYPIEKREDPRGDIQVIDVTPKPVVPVPSRTTDLVKGGLGLLSEVARLVLAVLDSRERHKLANISRQTGESTRQDIRMSQGEPAPSGRGGSRRRSRQRGGGRGRKN